MSRWGAVGALLVFGFGAVTQALAGDVSKIDRYQPRFGRQQPVVAVVGENAATELTDFVIPYGILSDSGAAEVHAVATGAGAIRMWPALTLQPDMTLAIFDARFTEGADYVIVPAVMSMDKKSSHILVDWIRSQADKGATIVSICDGALTVAAAGVFKGRRATGHWATFEKRKQDFPDTEWLENTRYVADGKAISSAGVSASIPLSLALVEAIAGTERAQQVAGHVGVRSWSSTHDSGKFELGVGGYSLAIGNWILPSTQIGIPVADGVDEIALALAADAYSRTYRSRAYSVANTSSTVRTRRGLALLPDRIAGEHKMPKRMKSLSADTPAQSLDRTLADIESLFGARTARFVALQMEYPR